MHYLPIVITQALASPVIIYTVLYPHVRLEYTHYTDTPVCNTMMKLSIVFIMISNYVNTASDIMTTNHSQDIHDNILLLAKHGHLRNIQSMNAVLMKYVN